MPRLVASFVIPFFCAATALAVVPMPLVGSGCDDENPRDGFIDNVADCPDDFVRCLGITNQQACLDIKDCSWNDGAQSCEGSFWDYISYIPARWRSRVTEPIELDMGAGMHADRAWQRETGRFDTTVAVMDSGIRWSDWDLRNKYRLNRRELPVPQDAGGADCGRLADATRTACPAADAYDCNQDCIFNIQDYAGDPRIPSYEVSNDPILWGCFDTYNFASALPLLNDFLEPSDLLCVFADGVDGVAGGATDGNGYVDDICGWDHLWDDPNPYDDTNFGHGTGEAKDSTAEGDNGGGLPGVCASCSLLPVRVGDSFVVDTNNWAAGMIFAVDSGAKVLQSAVGAINNPGAGRAAIEYAWDRGVINIMSAADETAQHPNYPAVLRHTAYVHAVRYDTDNLSQARTFLNFSNCTNFGGRLTLSVPSTGCSSGATGVSSGISGLIASAMQDAMDADPTVIAAPGSVTGLSGSEIIQVLTHATDDIDLPTSRKGNANYDPERYPSKQGWDMYFGYGRINARSAVDVVLDHQIPPEADILEPLWFDLFDSQGGGIPITGSVAAPRDAVASWTLEVALGVEPNDFDPSVWTPIATGQSARTGALLGTLDPTTIAGFDPEARIEHYTTVGAPEEIDDNVTKARKVNRYTVTLRLRVTDTAGRSAEDRRTIYVHHDSTWKPGFPLRLGVSGDSSPKLFDLDGDGALEIILADADGWIHAFTASAGELGGWPAATNPGRAQKHSDSRAFVFGPDGVAESGDELDPIVRSAINATPAIGDITGNGLPEVVAVTLDGEIYAFTNGGVLLDPFPVGVPETLAGKDTNADVFTELGVFASPALGDLDGDGDLEIVVATLDQQVIALQGDGTLLDGFPVYGPPDANDPTKPFLRLIADPVADPDGQTRRIVSSPAIGDLDGDGNLEIVVGTNEAIFDQLSLVYAFTFDRDAGRPVAYGLTCGTKEAKDNNCWPLIMVGGYPNALPFVGAGCPGSPILADLDGDGTLEIGAASIADFGRLYRHDGYNNQDATGESPFRKLEAGGGHYGLKTNSHQSSSLVMINSGAFGDVDGNGTLDYFIGAAGANFVDNLLEDGLRADFDHQLVGWDTATGKMLDGFPQIMEDLQFFLNPVIADVDGDGGAEVINTSGTFVIHAFAADGTEPAGWPKFTGQWQIATPAVGDIDGDGLLELVAVTRAGYLYVYETDGPADGNVQWPGFRHDARNSGNYHTPDPKIPIADSGACTEGCCCTATSPDVSVGWVLLGLLGWVRRRR